MQLTFIGTGDAFSSGGRYHTCLSLEAGETRLLIDLGGSAMLGLQQARVARNDISTVLFTHYHGDHFAGLPFFILDAMFVSRRTAPLTIAGGGDVAARVRTIMEAMYPGFTDKPKPFEINYCSIDVGRQVEFGDVAVEAFPMVHDDLAGPCHGYRLTHGHRTLAFTGDTGWTDALIPLARNADVLVSECCYVDVALPNHINLRQLADNRAALAAERLLLTHMADDMIAYQGRLPDAEKAFDGLSIVV